MIQNILETIKLNKAYEIKSPITGRLYLDAERRSYIFLNSMDAKAFIVENTDTEIADPVYHDPAVFLETCYKNGTSCLVVNDGQKKSEIPLAKGVVSPGYYNSELNAWLTLFKATKNPMYLEKIAHSYFVIPIRVKFSLTQEIVYPTGRPKEGDYFYIAFSDLDEYNQWAQKVAGWDPLVVNFDVMCQISKEHGFMVNPLGNQIMLPAKIMEKYRKFANTQEPQI